MSFAPRALHRSTIACLLLLMPGLHGCVTAADEPTATRKVIDRSPGDGMPTWAKGKKKFEAEGDRVGFVGTLTMDADANGNNCTHAAGTEAKGRIASLISATIMDEAGISGDEKSTVSNRLTAALSEQKVANVEIADEYWQLIEIDDGEKPIRRLECFAEVTIPKKVLDRIVERAMAEITKDPAVAHNRQRLEDAEKHMEGSDVAH